MYHFLARLGRKPWIKIVLPAVSTGASLGYLAPHSILHPMIRKLFTAQKQDGGNEEITPELKQLIVETFEDIKTDFNKPMIEGIKMYFASWKPIIKWFPTSSLEPQVFGMVETYTGVLIGLPYYYNYEKVSELPSQVYQFKKLSLFKPSPKHDKTKKESSEAEEFYSKDSSSSVTVDPHTPAGEAYLDSMVLSEKAKKFSIARELCYADSYRVLGKSMTILISSVLPVTMSRAVVAKLKLTGYHISYRIPFYIIAGLAGLGHYILVGDSLELYYNQKADSRALATSQYYREGGIEYFGKLLQRNKALRALSEEFKFMFDEEGNLIDGLFRNRYISLTERLKQAMSPTPEN